jgi:hypothetical protein
MDESVYASQVEPGEITLDTYETLYGSLYAYRSGIIGFLELLDRFEKILHIKLPQTSHQEAADATE